MTKSVDGRVVAASWYNPASENEGCTMTYRGYVRNGEIVLDQPADLPDGTPVRIEPMRARSRRAPAAEPKPRGQRPARKRKGPPTLYDRLRPFVGQAPGLPEDFSINHDHYLYGVPKRI